MTTKQKIKEAISLINWWLIAIMSIIMNAALICDKSNNNLFIFLKYNFIFIFIVIIMILDRYMNIDLRENKKNLKSKHNCSCNNCSCNDENNTKIGGNNNPDDVLL